MIDFILFIDEKRDELDCRQPWKVRYPLSTILFLVFVSQLAGITEWQGMEDFVELHEEVLGQYVDLSQGCPSHDTLERVISLLNPDKLKEVNDFFKDHEEAKLQKTVNRLIAIDGKTIRGTRSETQKPVHVVTAYDGLNHLSLGQKAVEEKTNEVTAIPRLLRALNIQKSIITIDAMGTQTEIVDTIIKGKADYCLAVKGNQGTLYEDVALYFSDAKILDKLTQQHQHCQTTEKARGQIEVRDYYVSYDVKWLTQNHPKWPKLKGIGMTKNTIDKKGKISEEIRYYIISFKDDVQTFARCVRGHWSVESMHWLLDVVYREDQNRILDKRAALNLNLIRKDALFCLKHMSFPKKKMSYHRKMLYFSTKPADYLPQLF